MKTLDTTKLSKLHSADKLFTKKYGARGTSSRDAFEEKAIVNYYSEIFREQRKKLKLTQAQVAERIGKKRAYVTLLEKGETDMQLSTFFSLSNALGFRFSLT